MVWRQFRETNGCVVTWLSFSGVDGGKELGRFSYLARGFNLSVQALGLRSVSSWVKSRFFVKWGCTEILGACRFLERMPDYSRAHDKDLETAFFQPV